MCIMKLALIGLGPHAKRIYYPYIESHAEIELTLIVDLKSQQQNIKDYISSHTKIPKDYFFLDNVNQIIPKEIDSDLANKILELGIERAIVSTEPKAHRIYLEFFAKHKIPVLVDKPITAPTNLLSSVKNADKLYYETKMLAELGESSKIYVQCQRRNHEGYNLVFKFLKNIVSKYQVPITNITVHHSGGKWHMPNEYFELENHPYKYGYGKLMHSGYHFVDLLISILKTNNLLRDSTKHPDTIELFSQYFHPKDHINIINKANYTKFFGAENSNNIKEIISTENFNSLGEIDSYSQIQTKHGDNAITTAQISLMDSGISQRGWYNMPKDMYKNNGRIRHERIDVTIGNIANVQIHSYQSEQESTQDKAANDVGGLNHFDIYFFRNSNLIGGEPFYKVRYGDLDYDNHREDCLYLGQNEIARHRLIEDLLNNSNSTSEIGSYVSVSKLCSEIYKNHIKQRNGEIPFVKMNAKEILDV